MERRVNEKAIDPAEAPLQTVAPTEAERRAIELESEEAQSQDSAEHTLQQHEE